ncbi:ISAs1 family transposase [Micromonospora sp. LOL_027]|uniref:ISAs1 family transposase n=1 Tax=Micromonospora sp. LOL_027 TaxID=3345419 RepID=UPI003A8A9AB5
MTSSSLIDPVVDHLADMALWEAELAEDVAAADPLQVVSPLVTRLAQVPDPRRLRGLRHPLLVILVLTACATLVAGNDSLAAIRQWAARTPQDVPHRLGARRNPLTGRYLVPSERTFRRVLAAVDGDALDTATCGYAAYIVRGDAPVPQIPAAADEPAEREQRRAVTRAVTHPAPAGLLPAVAVDGKLLHGTRTTSGQVFLAAAVTHDTGAVLGQRQVADKRGETTVTEDLLAPLDVAGLLLTLDALHTTKKTARLITGPLHAHYLLILKRNQPLALQAAQALLSGNDIEFADQTDIDSDRGHGRTERRTIRVAPSTTACSRAPDRCSGYAATPADSTAYAPANRSSTASSASTPNKPARSTSTLTREGTGRWRIVCTGPETSPSTKTNPSSGPARLPATWPPCAT